MLKKVLLKYLFLATCALLPFGVAQAQIGYQASEKATIIKVDCDCEEPCDCDDPCDCDSCDSSDYAPSYYYSYPCYGYNDSDCCPNQGYFYSW